MDNFLLDSLVDPVDKTPLRVAGNILKSSSGRNYPIVEGIPIMLVEGIDQTIGAGERTLHVAHKEVIDNDPWYLDTTTMGDQNIAELKIRLSAGSQFSIDPVISYLIGATSGHLFAQLVGKLKKYPIPNIRLFPTGSPYSRLMLDIGCNWGRWSISAAKKGYNVIGIDPSLGAVLAGRRAAEQIGVSVHWLVGDARYLPFRDNSFEQAFSYSVIQHFSKPNTKKVLSEVGRVLANAGTSLIQMPNAFGVRSFYHLLRRRFREAKGFEVRYYTPTELLEMFELNIGPSNLSVDGFFGLGIQSSDKDFMPFKHKALIRASEVLRQFSQMVPFLKFCADSLYVESKKVVQ